MKNKKKISSLSILAVAGVYPYREKKEETYMNDFQLEHFKKILIAWKNQLVFELDRKNSYPEDESTNFPDPIDRAVQEEEFSLKLRNKERERKIIKKIEHTLKKIDAKEFGYCTSCGIEIGIKRLEARPTANLCIDCKTLEEIRAKQILR
ncbi:RNA polymerase-binding transcription factor DksA [Buchnera aphidicola (Thelaxes suberi)]|uniref:RNA polymerase-binding protein DksA n=1 Tax=Buchnera aphidicola TaxID=9 RepID=UPI003A659693